MSDIMLGVLKMTDDMFWSDDIITRHQHNQIRLEAAGVIESQKSIIAELEQQTKILQGNWDRCFNSRAEFIREKAELEQKLAQEREANRWIPVSERLHDNRAKQNLGRTKSGHYVICYHDELGFSVATEIGNRLVHNITHVQSITPLQEVK